MQETFVLTEALERFRAYKDLAEKSLAQVSDEEFFRQIDPESNSIAHLAFQNELCGVALRADPLSFGAAAAPVHHIFVRIP